METNSGFHDVECMNNADKPETKAPQCINSYSRCHSYESTEECHGIDVEAGDYFFSAKSGISSSKAPSLIDIQITNLNHSSINQEDDCMQFLECSSYLEEPSTLKKQSADEREESREHFELLEDASLCMVKLDSKDMPADPIVEIIESTIEDDARLDLESQATDCSSSFESTHSEFGYVLSDIGEENIEVQSFTRDGSGAVAPNKIVDLPRRKKKPLKAEWKMFRKGIEWRCHWLGLQVKELQNQAANYDHILNTIDLRKKQMFEQQNHLQNSAARALPIVSGWKNQVYHRRRRRKLEDSTEMLGYMSKHPVFSRYGKKQRQEEEVIIQDEPDADDFETLHLDLAISSRQEKLHIGGEQKAGDDSMERLLWDIESLQMNAMKLKNQLIRVTSSLRKSAGFIGKDHRSPRNSTPVLTFGSPASLSAAKQMQSLTSHPGNRLPSVLRQQPTSAVCRRRISDYDIDNVVMPRNVMAAYVEPARHTFIETPSWRLVVDTTASEPPPAVNSSEEDTDEEVYNRRHAEMEITERIRRYGPSNKAHHVKGCLRAEMQRSGKPHGQGQPVPSDNRHNYFGFIPKGKRRKHQDRKPFRVSRFEHLFSFQNSLQSFSWHLDTIIDDVGFDHLSIMKAEQKTLELDKMEN